MNYSFIASDGDIEMNTVRNFIKNSYNTENIPLEWMLLTAFYKWEIVKNSELSSVFIEFVKTFYPDYYKFFGNGLDSSKMVSQMCFFVNNWFLKMYAYGMTGDIVLEDGSVLKSTPREQEQRNRAIDFGAIVYDFLVRYLGYVIVNKDNKTILSVNDDTDGRILPLLNDGYDLYKTQGLDYIRTSDNPLARREFVAVTENKAVLPKSNMCL
ncbi:MAG: hypothetical protein HFI36_02950 [Bacilli bacterium]|jgi:hypothetical protein|nr:hypothetical protein [Bacilli bacterium]